jgi:hypothetical protein
MRWSSRPEQSIFEPIIIQTRDVPRRNEASARRDPSAFERCVLLSVPPFQPHGQSRGQMLAEALRQVKTSVAVSIPISTSAADPFIFPYLCRS